ncbi:MAG: hypothetical protein KatS3mg015_2496 [Fimbriimonadales bacterium]|nr:MAG: hypothetical protein KatS3mg015_2496 [Fimbriimonadales bacterium]
MRELEIIASGWAGRTPEELRVQALLIRGARQREAAIEAVRNARAGYLAYRTERQRRWQSRSPKGHPMRERYIR